MSQLIWTMVQESRQYDEVLGLDHLLPPGNENPIVDSIVSDGGCSSSHQPPSSKCPLRKKGSLQSWRGCTLNNRGDPNGTGRTVAAMELTTWITPKNELDIQLAFP